MAFIASQFGRPRGLLGRLIGKLMARSNREINEWTVALLDVQHDDHILEIGFGPGVSIDLVATIALDGFVTGIDVSETMLKQARGRNKMAIRDRKVELQHGSVADLPFDDESFDKVFAINSIQFWPQRIEALKQVCRVLKPEGIIAITLQPRWAKSDDMVKDIGYEIVNQVVKAGFDNVKMETRKLKPMNAVCIVGVKKLDADEHG